MLMSYWDAVMNSERNPLSQLPKTVRFQLMAILALMWTAIFCAMAGTFVWLPQFYIAHLVLLLIGFFGTRYIFGLHEPR